MFRDADAAALGKLDEVLAVAASAGDVIEGSATDLAREAYENILEEFETALSAEKEEVALLGGLHVIGTNLHDSQRVDDQLRGRAGRQGDPGSTHFFLSLEDRVFRVFGGDKVKGVLDLLRVPDDAPLESDTVSNAVKDTQNKVERYYYELRKALFDFDEVLAAQREATYARREAMLMAAPEVAVSTLCGYAELVTSDIFNANWPADAATVNAEAAEKLFSKLSQFFGAGYGAGAAALSSAASRREAQELASKAAAAAVQAKVDDLEGVRSGLAHESARYLTLLQMDNLWTAHMKAMGFVKDFAGLKVYNNEDPLDVYRTEGLTLFETMQSSVRQNTVYSFLMYTPKQQ